MVRPVLGSREPQRNGHPRHDSLLVRIREPRLSEGEDIWEMVREAEDLPRRGHRLLPALVQSFASHSLVATHEGRVLGFVGGYRPRPNASSVVIWQISVAPMARRQGLATALLQALVRRQACAGVEYVEAAIPASSIAGRRLFERFARDVDAAVEVVPSGVLPRLSSEPPEPDEIVRVGPIHIEHSTTLEGSHETL